MKKNLLFLILVMMNTFAYGWTGHLSQNNLSIGEVYGSLINKADYSFMSKGDSFMVIDTTFVLVPIKNIRISNAIYYYQLDQIDGYKEIVRLERSKNADITGALVECNNRADDGLIIQDRMSLQLREKDKIIKRKDTVLLTMSGIVVTILILTITK